VDGAGDGREQLRPFVLVELRHPGVEARALEVVELRTGRAEVRDLVRAEIPLEHEVGPEFRRQPEALRLPLPLIPPCQGVAPHQSTVSRVPLPEMSRKDDACENGP
jgi:hypothetical protein